MDEPNLVPAVEPPTLEGTQVTLHALVTDDSPLSKTYIGSIGPEPHTEAILVRVATPSDLDQASQLQDELRVCTHYPRPLAPLAHFFSYPGSVLRA